MEGDELGESEQIEATASEELPGEEPTSEEPAPEDDGEVAR